MLALGVLLRTNGSEEVDGKSSVQFSDVFQMAWRSNRRFTAKVGDGQCIVPCLLSERLSIKLLLYNGITPAEI